MKFTALKLTGFKSFVDPAELRIEPGLTGIIGPNGCGKSNLLEALRWVMGATSAKSLRGSGMEDVIFSGTDARPSRDRAEVLLTVDNADRTAPARFNDHASLEVIRRITRGAGSQYKVNGEEVRAKDVQLLFADASTGANSPALVRQGQISELIAAKPENRRRVLEEAAGVAGLRARRHESELRLKGAETNLDRLQDVIDDLESRYEALQRQARQAARYRNLSGDIRMLEAALWLKRWQEARESLDAAEVRMSQSRAAAEDAILKAASASTAAESTAAILEPARQAEAEASAALRRLERERDALQRDAADVSRNLDALESRRKDLTASTEREAALHEDALTSAERAAAEVKALEELAAREQTALTGADAVRSDAEARRRKKDEALDAASRTLAALHAARDSARREVEQNRARLERLTRQLDTAEASLADMGDQFGEAPETAEARVKDTEAARAAAREALETAETARRDVEAVERAAIDARREIEGERSGLEREIAALERMLAQEAVDNRALDALRAAPGFEKALGAALGDDLDASLDSEAGRRWTMSEIRADALPAGSVPLSRHVTAPPALAARLEAIGVVDAEQASDLARQLKPGQRLVTRDGDLWRWDGYSARADAPSAAAARLEQRNRLDEARAELANLAPAIENAATKADAAAAELAKARTAESDARAAIGPADQNAREAMNALSKARETAAREAERRAALDAEITRLTNEKCEADAALTEASDTLTSAEADTGAETALNKARDEAERARRAADDARTAYDVAHREAIARKQKLEALRREHDDWTRRAMSAGDRITALRTEIAEIESTRAALEDRPAVIESALEALAETIASAERKANDARDAVMSAEESARTADAAARAAEREASAAREARAADEARLSAAQERLEETTDRLRDACGAGPEALKEQVDDKHLDLDLDDVERRLDSARQSRERLGAVNLRADEEAEALQAQSTELTKEREDLIAAIDRLRKGIDALSREGRARLLEAFERVDAHFRTLFETLFEGGRAELRLTESDDPLEAGLEIFACPPGKKLENMALLSGGEQALTASALIFAIFLSNPAPVCVLDEVDAPLDDANVDRYCRMLDEMRRLTETRFLVITHNPLTMSRMDRLYGVTMAERGVSQLVSVDLQRAETLIAAE
ncbi:MAG: chromosome segregation protein SMC [Maricaulis sp.]|nr:chromosome segregation protein SMC [Maricaulis sp.]HAQ35991.1 chromosome segregation protein SMC [Alphaproteobacteria bacterium]